MTDLTALHQEYEDHCRQIELAAADATLAVAERIAPEGRWTQRTEARDQWGGPVDPTDQSACSWCVIGAIARETHDRDLDPVQTNYIYDTIGDAFDDAKLPATAREAIIEEPIARVNDHEDASQADIVEAIKAAAATMRARATD